MKLRSLVRVALPALAFVAASLSSAVAAAPKPAAAAGPKLGLQTWTCRNMTFDEVVAFAVKHGITNLQLISKHMDPKAPAEETLRKKAILEKNGLTAYTFGVNGTSMDKEANRKLFEFAKLIGAKLIIVEPRNLDEWDNLEQLVKEYDIKLAIHNHGTGTVYGDPATVKKILAARDPRIGVCLDVGWVTAAGFNAAEVFRSYGADRVFDMHLKDKRVEAAAPVAATAPKAEAPEGKKGAKKAGGPVVLDVEIGTGQAAYKELFAEIKKSKWSGVMAIETDNATFAQEPSKLVAGAVAFFKANAK
ncbi:MAG: sugar phosphate isomerase/epimerase [Opitutaceae bacterium]|nr:sugar phosphate isomerase/epimerase [Opitutaceae bacterium]